MAKAKEVEVSDDKNHDNQPVAYSMSVGLVPWMLQHNTSIAISSYQSGRFYLLGANPKTGLMVDERLHQKAMGMAINGQTIALATLFQIHQFENTLNPEERLNEIYDACYVPRKSFTTGVLDAHDIGFRANNDIVFVNTRYNCLATLSDTKSFTPIWKPFFIDKIIDEDRCHLNGMAMENSEPRYVTAVSKSNTIDGWRDRRSNGGVVIDVVNNEVICEGLSMPHSPRVYHNKLWVLNSGTGELGWVDKKNKKFVPKVFCPGFVRGLFFVGKYALVGLSKPRYERFEGLALDAKLEEADSEAWCGVQVIDLEKETCVQWFRIDGVVGEIYDVAAIKGITCPISFGFGCAEIRSLVTFNTLDDTSLRQDLC